MAAIIALLVMTIIMVSFTSLASAALSVDYYQHTCPQVESIVSGAVYKAAMNDITVPAALLRMHFHDCFIRGCDGSVLLESKGNNKAEKDGPPNISLHAFYVIDNAKKAIEAVCPGVVSCADILALAARDAVHLSGGPYWDVPKGRKDGRISKAIETRQLPAPTFNISQLQQSFSQRGLSLEDLVALSGGHTLGFAHCSSFQNRIHNFSPNKDVDPSLNPSFATNLRTICPSHNKAKNAGSPLDSTNTLFDNAYYKLILQGKSIFSSDQALLTNPKTKSLVSKFANAKRDFENAFVKSMIKMSSITGAGAGQEIRLHCKHVR
ncbi:Peroxidase 64 [Stylosanthes scabra]|uniref:Peroxidase n=1 Tax=Stylosanthes scabra TaxID=79078 RepID=A0ABU6WL13_9FABA|nr:Peroxidase 64 [Stylosanthes scabra]